MLAKKIHSETKSTLMQLIDSINKLDKNEYNLPLKLLGNATIGQHTRHIIEVYQILIHSYNEGVINYDDRNRDIRIETDVHYATECIINIISNVSNSNKNLAIITLYNDKEEIIESTYDRELMYNIEHCIHHQAIIKIGMLILEKNITDDVYGVAKSTALYRTQCVQ